MAAPSRDAAHAQLGRAIGQQDAVVRLEASGDVPRQPGAARRRWGTTSGPVSATVAPDSSSDGIGVQLGQAQLGTGQVGQDADRAPGSSSRSAHDLRGVQVVLDRAVGEVDACDVETGVR